MIRPFIYTSCMFCGSFAFAIGPFVPPKDKTPPFRRDRLPLEDSHISGLANNLSTLTSANTMHTPEERRHFAQAFALISALKPQNQEVKERIESLKGGDHSRKLNDPEKVGRIKEHIWRQYDWLSSQDAGKDANILANYLGDIISAFDRENPKAQVLTSRADTSRWDGWVAPLDAFKEKEVEQPVEKPSDNPGSQANPKEKFIPEIRLNKSQVTTVLQTYDKELHVWAPNVVTVTMESDKDDHKEEWEERQSSIKIHVSAEEHNDWPAHDMIASPIKDMLEKTMGKLPRQGRIKIKANDKGYEYRHNHGTLTGSGLVVANACLTGKAPKGTVIGEIGSNGEIILPEYFWSQLMVLVEKGEGGRLVLPAGAAEYMPSLLAMGKAEFFLKYEVLIASSVQEFLDLSSSEVSPEVATMFSKFAEIVEKAPKGQVGSYVSNRFVRQRLQEIVEKAPYHISAKMLAIQSAGSHPRYLSKKVLAAETWRSVILTGEIAKVNFWEINTRQIGRLDELQEEMRVKLGTLERYADSRDREIVKNAAETAALLKILHRDLRADENSRMERVMKTRDELVDRYEELENSLSELSGDPVAGNSGKRKRFRLRGEGQ